MGDPPRKRRQDPSDYDPLEDRQFHGISREEVVAAIRKELETGKPMNGIEVGYKGIGAKISGSQGTLNILVVLTLAIALAAMIYYVDRGFKDARTEASVTARTIRNYHEWMRYDHAGIAWDKKRSDCIALMTEPQRARTNEELNVGGDPLQYRCRWLGQPPIQPALSP